MSIRKLVLTLLLWRILLSVFVYFGINLFPLQRNFLGGGTESYLNNPYVWSFANFDGEHYISIAKDGYKPLTHFFFPFYPFLINQIAKLFGNSTFIYLLSGLLISHISLVVGIIGLIKLIRIDYAKDVAENAVLILLLFPTSFYLGSVYTESLFFALTIWSLYYSRKNKWFSAGVFSALASGTRIFGLALMPTLFMECFKKKPGFKQIWKMSGILLAPLGILLYMYYLKTTTGDPLAFFNNVSIFGEQRSTRLILFPQVFYRYFFKILPALNFNYFPVVFTTFLEITTASVFLIIIIFMFYKKMWTYAIYSLCIFTIVSFSGSFSSFPRYALSIFPVFIVLSLWLTKFNLVWRIAFFSILFISLFVATSLYSRGYWIS